MNSPEFDTALFQLEAAIEDPYFEKVTQKAKEFKQLVDETDELEIDEMNAIIAELDGEVAGCIQAPMQCFGYIYKKTVGEVSKEYFEGEAVFNGYVIIEDPETYRRTLMYHLYIPQEQSDLGEESGERVLEGAVAHLDTLNIEFDVVSFERARAWLGAMTPELLEDIDIRVLNAEGTEANAIMSLREFDFNLLGREDYAMAQKCLNV